MNRKYQGKTEYNVTIPERADILAFLQAEGTPHDLKHIAEALGVKTSAERAALSKRLKAMVRDGQIIRNRKQGYGLLDKMDLIAGRVIGHADGYGFLRPDDEGDDVYLSGREMRGLLHGDRAAVRVTGHDTRERRKGALVEVLDRANDTVVGRYFAENNIGFVIPDNRRIHQDIYIPEGQCGKAKFGQFVVAKIIKQPDKHTQPVGQVIEILGDHAAPGMATEIAIRAHELPYEWPAEVEAEIAAIDADEKLDGTHRRDLRALDFVTIDGEDARDFDDAVYCEREGAGWRLLVAIADVAHYVLSNSALDQEAELRGTSVYFPDKVVPMLPEVLSNELCSLKPQVDRLVMVCELCLNKQGTITRHEFYEGVICSGARLTYTEVDALVVDKNKELRTHYAAIITVLDNLHALFRISHKRRIKNGLLDFNSTESKLVFNQDGEVIAVDALTRNDAHRLIEEFMLMANVAAAKFLLEHEAPILYRNHEPPKQDKLAAVREFLAELGLVLGGGDDPTAKDYARVIEQVQNRKDAHLIETVLLRSLSLAVYSETNLGHFGLAYDAYTHFTSPIRRYPDLLVHRTIRHLINNKKGDLYSKADMHRLGNDCSSTERRAEEASRAAVQRLKCEYMQSRVGEEFTGSISSVTAFGLFVELDEIHIEGLVHVTSLPRDYYHFDPLGHRLKGERTNKTYRLANRVRVQVIRVDLDEKKIDFELIP